MPILSHTHYCSIHRVGYLSPESMNATSASSILRSSHLLNGPHVSFPARGIMILPLGFLLDAKAWIGARSCRKSSLSSPIILRNPSKISGSSVVCKDLRPVWGETTSPRIFSAFTRRFTAACRCCGSLSQAGSKCCSRSSVWCAPIRTRRAEREVHESQVYFDDRTFHAYPLLNLRCAAPFCFQVGAFYGAARTSHKNPTLRQLSAVTSYHCKKIQSPLIETLKEIIELLRSWTQIKQL